MLLRLKYSDTAGHALRGALIRGDDAAAWLAEISRWGIPAEELECYVMPESISSVRAGGLFVCFSASVPPLNLLQHPYGRVGESLYLPLHADLHPDMHERELQSAFLWERQVFHPVVGMVGFERKNRLNLASLLNFPSSLGKKWDLAQPGMPVMPHIEAIGLDRPPMEQFMDSMKEVGSAPPEEIPGGDAEETAGQKFARDLQKGALKGALGFMEALNKAFSGGDGKGGSGSGGSGGGKFTAEDFERFRRSGGTAGPGLFERMQNWLNQRLEDLEAKRKAELDRLVDLFEKDPDAALKYAIPLGGDYWKRGTAPPSSSLGTRSTNFNLGDLGGGKPVDGWNVDGYEAKLRQRYLEAANREIEAGNYRKAAYIHAHLLHDFNAAANVLEQGHFYREAAALYKDHLKNVSAAAECLERGGLLLDAIELYVELGKREKAADLYITLKQKDKADILYQACADDAVAKGDYLEAGRLYLEKMERPEKAMENYLDGWKGFRQTEACLNSYLDLYQEHGKSALQVRLESLYRKETQASQVDTFFRVLVRQRGRQEDAAAREVMDELAFEIISEQAKEGHFQSLNSIKTFVPDDRLVGGDMNRYIQDFRKKPAEPQKRKGFAFDDTVRWGKAIGIKDSVLAIGVGAQGEICLGRADWDGHVELHRLPGTVGHAGDSLMHDPAIPGLVYLLPQLQQKIPVRTLPVGLKFKQELRVMSPPGYSGDTLAVGIDDRGNTVILESARLRSAFHWYDGEGKLTGTQLPTRAAQDQFLFLHAVADGRIRFHKQQMLIASGPFVLVKESKFDVFSINPLGSQWAGENPPDQQWFFPSVNAGKEEVDKLMRTDHWALEPVTWAVSPYAKKLQIAMVSTTGVQVIADFVAGQAAQTLQPLVDADFEAEMVEFLPGDFLLVAGSKMVQVYDMKGGLADFLVYFTVDAPIIGIMPTDMRCEIAVVLATGAVKIFDFDRYG